MERKPYIEIPGSDTNLVNRSRRVWINPQHIVYVEDFDSSPDVAIHLTDGTTINVSDNSGDMLQGYFSSNAARVTVVPG